MPGTRCAVAVCSNSLVKTKKLNLKISYHAFPKREKTRRIWVNACYRNDKWNPTTSYICSEHFETDCFENKLQIQLMTEPIRRRLRPGAVPTLNLHKSNDFTPATFVNREKQDKSVTAHGSFTAFHQTIREIEMSSLEYSKAFASHVTSLAKNVHHCKVCPHFTTSLFLMVNHVRCHKSVAIPFSCDSSCIDHYYCNDCDFQTELTVLLKQHIARHHSIKREEEDLLNNEFNIHNYFCEKCSFETNFALKWLQHSITCLENEEKLQTVSTAMGAKRSTFKCSECEFKSIYKHCVTRHKYLNHLNDSLLKQHINIKHLDERDTKWYKCEKCPHKSKHKGNLKAHINAHHLDEKDVKWYECKKCSFRSKHKHYVKMHVNTLHLDEQDIKWYECRMCPYKTKYNSNLKQHINVKHLDVQDVKWFECKECSYRSKYNSTLKSHVNAHHLNEENVKWYECKMCSYKAKQNSNLRQHINARHLDEQEVKWYSCKMCSFRTKQQSHLNRHIKKAHHLDKEDVK